MHTRLSRRSALAGILCLATAFPLVVPAQLAPASPPRDEEDEKEMIVLSPFEVTGFGATPGGAQDINFFRSGAGRGEVPHPSTITAEGLFSQHDLPLQVDEPGRALLCVQTAAIAARFEVLPEARWLAQLGFSSGLRPDTWKRAPLNLVAVVDKSGSMSGPPLALVRASLLSALDHLADGDQLSIVLYGDTSHVFLETTSVNADTRPRIAGRISTIESAGSTYMEAGLKLGYSVARESARGFTGTTRVMLFTDERPNVGNTAASGFMAMAESASRDGIGLTTIGVGVQFGAELATRISSVRGGNLFFFPDGAEMKRTFAEDFDTMVTELAHDLSIRIEPAAGLRVCGVFGVPGDLLRWDGRALVLDVATIFLSKRKGAIYFALAPEEGGPGLPGPAVASDGAVASVALGYLESGATDRTTATSLCRVQRPAEAQTGLRRGVLLVDEYLSLRKAASLHLVNNDQEGAFRLVHGLMGRLAAAGDSDLADELKLAGDMHNTLAVLSGHVGEVFSPEGRTGASPLAGVWRQQSRSWIAPKDRYAIFWPNGVVELITVDRRARAARQAVTFTHDPAEPPAADGTLALSADDAARLGHVRCVRDGEVLRLQVEQLEGRRTSWTLTPCAYADLPLPAADDADYESGGTNHEDCLLDLSGLPDDPVEYSVQEHGEPTTAAMR